MRKKGNINLGIQWNYASCRSQSSIHKRKGQTMPEEMVYHVTCLPRQYSRQITNGSLQAACLTAREPYFRAYKHRISTRISGTNAGEFPHTQIFVIDLGGFSSILS